MEGREPSALRNGSPTLMTMKHSTSNFALLCLYTFNIDTLVILSYGISLLLAIHLRN